LNEVHELRQNKIDIAEFSMKINRLKMRIDANGGFF